MRIAFLGSASFAVPSLTALLDDCSHAVVAVLTQEDRPKGRGLKVQPTPVKVLALQRGVPVHQPARIRSEECRALFNTINPELIVVVAYGQILPKWLLELPGAGAVNVHASLLPKYRGAAPIQWAILKGETLTGVTTIQMDEGMDSGDILLQESIAIMPDETAGVLHDRLAPLGARLLLQTLIGLESGTLKPLAQETTEATMAPKIRKEMGRIDWNRPAGEIHNQIRGLNPWPGCYGFLRGQEFKVWSTSLNGNPLSQKTPRHYVPGTLWVSVSGTLHVTCREGTSLEIRSISQPNRRRISGAEFVRGIRIVSGETVT